MTSKATVLPLDDFRNFKLNNMARDGFEPSTYRFSVYRSTPELPDLKKGIEGFEPSTVGLTVQRSTIELDTLVRGARFELTTLGYEPNEIPFLHPLYHKFKKN